MQLFITNFKKQKSDQILIDDEKNMHQITNVLRLRHWDIFYVQNDDWTTATRHQVEIEEINRKNLVWKILATESNKKTDKNVWMIIAMPNKRDKWELIAQKLSEIWVDEIIFRPSERSVIKEFNEKKLERLNLIIKEAVEQSRWRFLPKVSFTKDITEVNTKDAAVIVFDKENKDRDSNIFPSFNLSIFQSYFWVVWPEWWLTPKDYEQLWWNVIVKNLWSTVLRMETAAIVGARVLKNNQI